MYASEHDTASLEKDSDGKGYQKRENKFIQQELENEMRSARNHSKLNCPENIKNAVRYDNEEILNIQFNKNPNSEVNNDHAQPLSRIWTKHNRHFYFGNQISDLICYHHQISIRVRYQFVIGRIELLFLTH